MRFQRTLHARSGQRSPPLSPFCDRLPGSEVPMLPAPCRLSLFLVLAMALSIPASAHRRETGFLDRTVTVNNLAYKYQVYVPDNWSPNRKWPVILFLHGAVERGSDGLLQTQVGIATAIR